MTYLGHNDFVSKVMHEPKMHKMLSVLITVSFALGAGCLLLKCMNVYITEKYW